MGLFFPPFPPRCFFVVVLFIYFVFIYLFVTIQPMKLCLGSLPCFGAAKHKHKDKHKHKHDEYATAIASKPNESMNESMNETWTSSVLL